MYNTAVCFKPLSDTSSIGLTFYAAILQFNTALTHHVKAASSTTESSSSSNAINSKVYTGTSGRGISGDEASRVSLEDLSCSSPRWQRHALQERGRLAS